MHWIINFHFVPNKHTMVEILILIDEKVNFRLHKKHRLTLDCIWDMKDVDWESFKLTNLNLVHISGAKIFFCVRPIWKKQRESNYNTVEFSGLHIW